MASAENSDRAVETAYSRLESMIRNFSREKMSLEEKIGTLRHQIELRDKDIEEKNQLLKNLTLEKDRLQVVHEEDAKSRFAVEAM